MRLHEEYIQRHNLSVPVVLYDDHSQIILRSRNKPYSWRVISTYWRSGGHQPGYFEISCKMPVHNGYHKGKMLEDIIRPRTVFWDSYEGCVLDLIDAQKPDFLAVSGDETPLASWGIFLLVYDRWIAANVPLEFYEFASQSLDESLSMEKRWASYNLALNCLKGTEVEDVYKYQIQPWSDSHSKWLEHLIND